MYLPKFPMRIVVSAAVLTVDFEAQLILFAKREGDRSEERVEVHLLEGENMSPADM